MQALPGNGFLVSEFIYMSDENLKEKPHVLPGTLEYTVNSHIPWILISKNYPGYFLTNIEVKNLFIHDLNLTIAAYVPFCRPVNL